MLCILQRWYSCIKHILRFFMECSTALIVITVLYNTANASTGGVFINVTFNVLFYVLRRFIMKRVKVDSCISYLLAYIHFASLELYGATSFELSRIIRALVVELSVQFAVIWGVLHITSYSNHGKQCL